MDKFRELQNQIEKIINNLNKQIKDKNDAINNIENEIYETKIDIGGTDTNLKEVIKKRDTLSKIENKSIILYVIRNFINECINETKKNIKNKDWIMVIFPNLAIIIFGIILLVLIISAPEILFVMPYICLVIFSSCLPEMVSLRRLKKKNTVISLNEQIKNMDTNIASKKDNLEKYQVQVEQLLREVQALQAEKEYYASELKRIIQERDSAIEQIAMPLLNEAYARFDTSKVTSKIKERIRTREKKEGEE